jgi:hypothetical protein
MKKTTLLVLFVLVLAAISVSAIDNRTVHRVVDRTVTTNSEGQTVVDVQRQVTVNGNMVVNFSREYVINARNVSELKAFIQARKVFWAGQLAKMKAEKKELKDMFENRNKVRLAVEALLSMENMTKGIGKNISKIARDFNNSEKNESDNEGKIANRGKFIKWLWGGDRRSARALLNQVNLTEKRIDRLEALKANCTNCTAEVIQLIDDQIAVLKAEQQRLKDLANLELQYKGVFGWLFRSKED